MNARTSLGLVAGSCATLLLAFPETLPAQQPPAACTAPEHRQFDFWVGVWEVSMGSQVAGTNTITREYNGCVIVERWTGAKGLTGTSVNVYHAPTKRWHQTWVDSAGSLLLLDGEFKDGAMRLASPREGKTLHRVTWTPNADGGVRQLWEQSTDGGANWSVAFDGLYRRKSGGGAGTAQDASAAAARE